MANGRWEHFSHESDIGIRGVGETEEEAFQQAALALTAVIVDPHILHPTLCVELICNRQTMSCCWSIG